MKPKRLFLFAGYSKSGIIDDALVFYVHSLSKFGDIVLCMDSDTPASELKKVQKYCVHTIGIRHGEYDFGSYKRAYIWATENLEISDYDFMYLTNDSVYGPLFDMTPYFDRMESMPCDAFGMAQKRHKTRAHIQSWFIGLHPTVFQSEWFDDFMRSITKLISKTQITIQYEQGLSHMVSDNGLRWCGLYSVFNRDIYNGVAKAFLAGIPFIKKDAFIRHNGALGGQILYVLNHTDTTAHNAILRAAQMQYGDEYINWLLTRNPIKIIIRNIKHITHKYLHKGHK
ncbi:MAG: rhamnan synthesis F family protein [Alphaproteobacteria bacterium]